VKPFIRTGLFRLSLAAALLPAVAHAARAGGTEHRTFRVLVAGRHAGDYRMAVEIRDDGTVSVSGAADVRVSYIVVGYRYSYQGTEVWKDGRLQRFDSATNDDGKEYRVTAVPAEGGLTLTVNGQARKVRPDVWLTSYWHLPPAAARNQPLALIDADNGKDIAAKLEYVGKEKLKVAGHPVDCTHYRLTGGVQVDLWYDADERLVRQEGVEEGQKTVLELHKVER
jgi:hypothetical protein